jgi:hypothetical protein
MVMHKTVVALGLAGLSLAAASSTASAAFTAPSASEISSLKSDLTDVHWRRGWSPGRVRIAQFRPARHGMYDADLPRREILWLWYARPIMYDADLPRRERLSLWYDP